ncbi:MAG: SAM-dependent methyltransferase [Candidatus Moranbacteria bacterium]|nr:SAM-dependent methyltransferase [Candidatus Moranbacteria bacterium]
MLIITPKSNEYELIDSGQGEKLERFGNYVLSRPDKEALWQKEMSKSVWGKADLLFEREGKKTKWIIKNKTPNNWQIKYGGLNFLIKPTSFKHIGLFPEQVSNWNWMEKIIKKEKLSRKEINVLNLFAYTGGASMVCARAGASVCHVDASKQSVIWAKENAKLSGLEESKIRWIIDDAILFLRREIKRGRKYDAIIMDPPSFGHGPKDELWKIEEGFLELLDLCKQLLSDDPIFFLINGYTAGYSNIVYQNNLQKIFSDKDGLIEGGEIVIKQKNSDILLPCGIFARWSKK